MTPEEARGYGSDAPPDTDGTVTIDLCLGCRIRRAESLKGRWGTRHEVSCRPKARRRTTPSRSWLGSEPRAWASGCRFN